MTNVLDSSHTCGNLRRARNQRLLADGVLISIHALALKKSPSAASRRACTVLERSRRIAGRGRKIGHALNSTDEGSNVAERTEADILVHGAALRRTGTERTTAWDAFTLGRLDQHPRRPIPRSRRLLFHVVWRVPVPALITCTSPASVRPWLPRLPLCVTAPLRTWRAPHLNSRR